MTLSPLAWVLAMVAALLVGVSKTGVAGLGLLASALFAQVVPARQATGLVLPLLIVGDVIAVASYRRHANWRYLWRMFPWAAAGVVLGFLTLSRIDDVESKHLIGAIVLVLVILHLVRKRYGDGKPPEHVAIGPVIGILAGFTTLLANASGPLMAMYFLAMQLPKMEYMGTTAVFFLLINCFKVPFMGGLGLVNAGSLQLNLYLVAPVLIGTWLGRRLIGKMNQNQFEAVILLLTFAAGLRLIW
jgi:uncharacterized membrane protein YfcA